MKRLACWLLLSALFGLCCAPRSAGASDSGFAWFSVAPEIGYTHFFKAKLRPSGYDPITLAPRDGMVAKVHLDLGGDGIALELAPVYAYERSKRDFGDFHALGGEITFVFRFHAGSFYPGLGLGFHGAYLFDNPAISSGTQLYARLPVGFTWYFLKHLGLVFEADVMYGGTGIRSKNSDASPLDANARSGLSNKLYFAPGFALDILLGLRFP